MVRVLGEEGKSLGLTPRTPETKVWAGLSGLCQTPAIREASGFLLGHLRESLMFSVRQTPVLILTLPRSSRMTNEPHFPFP